jgi:hypothetical protein
VHLLVKTTVIYKLNESLDVLVLQVIMLLFEEIIPMC